MSTQLQIRRIHTLKTFLCMSDEVYRKMLQSFQVCSSKNLTETEANILISTLQDRADKLKYKLKKYDELKDRDEKMATPLQLRKLEATWNEIQRLKTNGRKTSLKSYLKNHFKVDNLKFLSKTRAGKIISVLERILAKKLEEYILKAC